MELLGAMLTVFAHTVIIYLFLIFMLSIFGRRQTSELGLVELIVIMVLGSAVETGMVNGIRSLPAGIVSAATLFLCNWFFSVLLRRWNWLQRVIVGRPVLLVSDGQFLQRKLRQTGLTEEDVMEGIRERGYESVEYVQLAVLEMDGVISVIPKKPKAISTQ